MLSEFKKKQFMLTKNNTKHWIESYSEGVNGMVYLCPECKADFNFKAFKHCPSCGQELTTLEKNKAAAS
jgi:rRNA maturation endonuclease Nob1